MSILLQRLSSMRLHLIEPLLQLHGQVSYAQMMLEWKLLMPSTRPHLTSLCFLWRQLQGQGLMLLVVVVQVLINQWLTFVTSALGGLQHPL